MLARFQAISAMAAGGDGNLYLSDTGSQRIRRMTPGGVVSTVGGSSLWGDVDGPGSTAEFYNPDGIAVDASGVLYIADRGNHLIRKGVPPAPAGPTISTQPTDKSIAAGTTTQFSVTASGFPAPAYRWQVSTNGGATWVNMVDTTAYTGTNGPTLQVASTPVALNLARYRCAVSNTGGSVTSDAAMLTVYGPESLGAGSLQYAAVKAGIDGGLTSVTPPQNVAVTFTGAAGPWTATSNEPWLVISSGAGVGNGMFAAAISNDGNVIGGSTHLAASVTVTAPAAPNSPLVLPVALTVDLNGAPTGTPFGRVDTPAQNAAGIQGSLGITGWALDDVGVATIRVYRPCLGFDNPASCATIGGHSLVYIANAAFIPGARPDVEAAYPSYPQSYQAGWGVQILTNMLPHIPNAQPYGGEGTFPLYVYATDQEGQLTLLGRTSVDHTPTSIAVDNDAIAKPFGAVDKPALAETVSGMYASFGWALTPDLDTVPDGTDILIPASGATMAVFVDGVSFGPATYNQCRGDVGSPPPGGTYCDDDVANIFGNMMPMPPLTPRSSNPTRFRNLDAGRGPQGFRVIDTTSLANGLHTIAWSVTDSNGRVAGIGSRFFSVLNSGAPAAGIDPARMPAPPEGGFVRLEVGHGEVLARTGFDDRIKPQPLHPDGNGVRSVSLTGVDRLELRLPVPVTAAYQWANGELRKLPIGAHLDAEHGVFTWAPPTGYFGVYRLVFVSGKDVVTVDVSVR